MKRSLTGIILIVAVLAIAGLLLALAVGSRPAPAAPTSPTEDAFRGVRVGQAREVTTTQDASVRVSPLPRLISSNTDGKTLVGIIVGDINEVVAIDLTSGAIRALYEGQAYPREPRVSGNHVVWTVLGSLYLYDLDSGQVEQKNFDVVRFARVSGDVVIWEQSGGDIWGYDLNNKNVFPVVTQPDILEMQPEISGEWVIYYSPVGSPNPLALWAINLYTGEQVQLGDLPQYYFDDPFGRTIYAIDVPLVVWSSAAELHLYNLDTRESFTAPVEQCIVPATVPGGSTQRWRPENLAISESIVISDGCGQQIGYDVERRVFFSLPLLRPELPEGELDNWTIADDRLVWILTEETFDGQEHSRIFTAQIERSP